MMAVTSARLSIVGGDGFIVMERLKARYDRALAPIKVVSAREATATKGRALKVGAVAHFQKPLNTHDSLRTVQKSPGQAAVPQGT
jgi:CheY-like chemotaxis protein